MMSGDWRCVVLALLYHPTTQARSVDRPTHQPTQGHPRSLRPVIRACCVSMFKRMKHTAATYWTWSWTFSHHTALCTVVQTIPSLSLLQRKDILGLCRSQTPIIPGSHQHRQLKCLTDIIQVPSEPQRRENDIQYLEYSFHRFLRDYQDVYLDHLSAAVIALSVRVAPGISDSDFQNSLSSSISKEISAAITISNQARFDFRSVMDSSLSSRFIPFTDRLPPSPEVASDTYIALCRVRSRLDNRFLLPTLGNKTVGQVVRHNFYDIYDSFGLTFKHEGRRNDDTVSTSDCMRLYLETGVYPHGPVEMRRAWTYNQLDPRVYYARGGDVMHTSQYVQSIANMLIDAFPETHRKDRFMPPRDPLADDDVEVIYDYSSFTSTLDSVVPFLDNLAEFFRGTVVHLVDFRNGVVPTDLGDLIARYNTECNLYGTFDASRVLGQSAGTTLLQHTCGMLGVEGNIFFATLLHGIHLRFIAGLNRSRCVGDDARMHHRVPFGIMDNTETDYLAWVLAGCGDLSKEKMGKFESGVDSELQAYRYIKRPIHRDGSIMIEGILLTLPSIIPLLGAQDRFHTVTPSVSHPSRRTYSQILRFIQELFIHGLCYDSDDVSWKSILKHLMFLRRLCIAEDPDFEHSMFMNSSYLTKYRFPPPETWGKMPITDWVVGDIMYDEVIRFPMKGERESEGGCDGRVGSEMLRMGSKARGCLVKLGYLEEEKMFDDVSVKLVGLDLFLEYLGGRYRSISKFVVVKDIPGWVAQVPSSL
ncbi:hypothetical protein [Cryphonectria parasitica ambivirus 1]|uniref:Uncharacterized protein n=1 Tax=Cryphonectria parasitica ambivirus 1 TaxID=2755407 RepID=A0A7D7F460_9VIRU|nr:hypothetical protein [Cryphonectria parasitica ambivirus 1]